MTSCSIDSEGYQLGQAYVKDTANAEGTAVAVFCGSARTKAADVAGVGIGDKISLPEPAVILSRFPSKKK